MAALNQKMVGLGTQRSVIRELFEIMKYGSSYSEARYASFVEEAVLEDVDESSLADLTHELSCLTIVLVKIRLWGMA